MARHTAARKPHINAGEPTAKNISEQVHPRYGLHLAVVVAVILLGISAGGIGSYLRGRWLQPEEPKTLYGIGRIEAIRLPIGARRLRDIRTFALVVGGSDDFGRVYVNNYLVASGENPKGVFYTDSKIGEISRNKLIGYARDRANHMVGNIDVRWALQVGTNYVVQELENVLDTCVTSMDMLVNGIELEHFPQRMPDNWYIEKGIGNEIILQKYEAASTLDAQGRKLGVSALGDALCARRIWEFTVN